MSKKHTPVRIDDTLYEEIKVISDGLGMSTKKCVEILLRNALEEFATSKTISFKIHRNGGHGSITIK